MQQLSITEAQPSVSAADTAAAAPAQPAHAQAAEPSAEPGQVASSGTASADAAPSAASAATAVDISNPDAVAVHCLLAGCHSVNDSELPIMTSDFQSKHMLPNLPEGGLYARAVLWSLLSGVSVPSSCCHLAVQACPPMLQVRRLI
jgi:hypothetical protein